MHKTLFIFLFLLPFNCLAQLITTSKNIIVVDIASKLKSFHERYIVEKSYLQFDKPYYAAGDTIYFKAYVTMGGENHLSALSGILHVDLINTNNKIDQSIKLQLKDGVAWGDFALPDTLPKGNYRVRAYTQWMRNDGDEAYFDQAIPIGSNLNNKITENGTRDNLVTNYKADIQFFPEGGKLVTGLRSKVAFKAIGGSGLGIDVKGEIIDSGKVITSFASRHLGMGYFYLTPQKGKTYKARINYADGTQNSIDLPRAENSGIILSVDNDSIPKVTVKIEANNDYYKENKDKEYPVIIYSGGIITSLTCKLNDPLLTMDILKRRLHTGVATITLFSPFGEPLCERLFFVQKFDQLNLIINSDKATYRTRERVNIHIKAKTRADEPSDGNFSASVIDESKVSVDLNSESTILTNLLLTSDLKGFVEHPDYYFNDISDKTTGDLDLVMLTHGFRRFEWKQVLNDDNLKPIYQPEKALEITGTAKTLSGKPLTNGIVSLISKGGSFVSTITGREGVFRFGDLKFSEKTEFILQAVNSKGRNNVVLSYDKGAPEPSVSADASTMIGNGNLHMTDYMENNQKLRDYIEKYGSINGKILKEVKIKDIKRDNNYKTQSLAGAGNADQVVHSEELEKTGGTLLSDRLLGKMYGRAVDPISGKVSAGLIIVDGIQMPDHFNINDINADDVETVESIYGANAAMYGINAGHGVLIITTKGGKGMELKDITSKGILPISLKGFYKARAFYSPKYEVSTPGNNRPDLRTTIYWNPELITDKDGNASFSYYNADGTGSYRIVIEGIDGKGNIGRQVYKYKVE